MLTCCSLYLDIILLVSLMPALACEVGLRADRVGFVEGRIVDGPASDLSHTKCRAAGLHYRLRSLSFLSFWPNADAHVGQPTNVGYCALGASIILARYVDRRDPKLVLCQGGARTRHCEQRGLVNHSAAVLPTATTWRRPVRPLVRLHLLWVCAPAYTVCTLLRSAFASYRVSIQ